jgi:programmed cell death 6-interacting protein
MEATTKFERWDEVEPVMFQDIMDEELDKYDKFLESIGESEQKQKDILSDVQVRIRLV